MTQTIAERRVLDSVWRGCYGDGWQGEIVPEAFAHPAKVSRALVRRIYEHAFAEGWLVPGSGQIICDPFAGIAGTCIDALWNGLTWIGCELEPRFVGLAEQNIALWQRKYGSKQGFGSARIVQGDSRKLAGVIARADLICSSPPFAAQMNEGGAKGDPANNVMRKKALRTGRNPDAANLKQYYESYGQSPGQLGAMKEGDFDMVVSSPPYEGSINSTQNEIRNIERLKAAGYDDAFIRAHVTNPESQLRIDSKYGVADGNIGNQSGDTFWQASAEILAQCYAILKPGGHAIWVCKDFVRKGKRVPFSDQWQALCEAEGFRLVCRHRAMLVAHHGEQDTIFGDNDQITTERKSFFRRLAEKKGSPPIDYEDVICMERLT